MYVYIYTYIILEASRHPALLLLHHQHVLLHLRRRVLWVLVPLHLRRHLRRHLRGHLWRHLLLRHLLLHLRHLRWHLRRHLVLLHLRRHLRWHLLLLWHHLRMLHVLLLLLLLLLLLRVHLLLLLLLLVVLRLLLLLQVHLLVHLLLLLMLRVLHALLRAAVAAHPDSLVLLALVHVRHEHLAHRVHLGGVREKSTPLVVEDREHHPALLLDQAPLHLYNMHSG